jgi:D-methionine transport system ATP-binding protein
VKPADAAVAVSELRHAFRTRAGDLVALDDVTFTVAAGGYAALVGPSGAGKTTLLSIIGGLEPPQAGSVVVDGHDLSNLDGDELAGFRRDTVGFVFQHFGLLDPLTAIENVELALVLDRADRRTRRRRAQELLDAVGLQTRAGHRPIELSGGERQRVAIARAIAAQPSVLICDEVTSALDVSVQAAIVELIEELRDDLGLGLLFVTHNLALISTIADRVLVMSHGRIVEHGPVRTVLDTPREPYTQELLADTPTVEAAISE